MALIVTDNFNSTSQSFVYNRGYIYTISTIAALGGLLFGFDLAIISGAIHFFSEYFKLNEYDTGLAVGCINIGAALGALLSGKASDLLGRKKLLIICALLFAITGVGTGWALSFPMFITFRILSGVAIGSAALVCPMYIAEISPAPFRGRLVTFYQLAICLGILLAYLSNYLLLNTGINNWRWMFSSQSAPALLFFLGLLTVSESPRWLMGKNREAASIKVLEKIGGMAYAESEGRAIKDSFSNKPKESVYGLFRKDVSHIILIGVIIAIFSQIGGQNSILCYAPEIFKQAGMAQDSAFLQSIVLGIILMLFTFIAIATIDKTGRKNLLKYGALLLAIDAISLTAAFYFHAGSILVLVLVLGFIAIYSATLGPVTWVVLSEVFPNRIRGNAMSLATLALWIANFVTVSSFPVMKAHFGLGITFGIHGVICFIYFIYVSLKIPETKGRSLEEIEEILTRK